MVNFKIVSFVAIVLGFLAIVSNSYASNSQGAKDNCKTVENCADVIAKLTGKKYLFNQLGKRSLRIPKATKITPDNAHHLFQLILWQSNLSRITTAESDTFRIIEKKELKSIEHSPKVVSKQDRESFLKSLDKESPFDVATIHIPMRNDDLLEMVKEILLKELGGGSNRDGKISTNPSENMIIITDQNYRLSSYVQLIQSLDQ